LAKAKKKAVRAMKLLPLCTLLPDGEMLNVPVRPLNIPKIKPAKRREGNLITALLWGDTHFPNQNDKALRIVRQSLRMYSLTCSATWETSSTLRT
jgi:hypothetical protein